MRKKPRLLSSTRQSLQNTPSSLSSKQTRSVIRGHHTLRKQLRQAVSGKNEGQVRALEASINASGGLAQYQRASIQGQSADRGGDSSKVLLEWFADDNTFSSYKEPDGSALRMLEVGALRVDNACARSKHFDIERIDLRSQHPLIKQQDFMERPVPDNVTTEGFDIVSLSLVLNFVDDATDRGEMLKRVALFLRNGPHGRLSPRSPTPSLFLVIPSPCVDNSRYLDQSRLEDIMTALGYILIRDKRSAKLAYYLWQWKGNVYMKKTSFRKQEVRSGKMRNNFAIVLPCE